MRVLICGGRDLNSSDVWNWLEHNLKSELQQLRLQRCFAAYPGKKPIEIKCIIHGGARGADEGAAQWGESEHVQTLCYRADWKRHGKAAGPIRNQRMIDEGKPNVCVAFPGGRGTADMVSRAEAAGIPVIRAE